ncbi:hypothetical protein J2X20_003324 [Pelomonas saccharophila]|uniref:TnsA endonuclease N-terminal domain-containing protein n=1 Tax=Roseateles saccharophilus TaxID=304 RepID=A0ABU1YR39_ROSSA|nr:TnsA endonuclease N-terminal domain-containing protein [Roseateles saccharophilus]MDR7270666.1 hypothetical protein [Roseateles saccharophilus]
MVEFEELLELDLMHLLEAAPEVAAYRQQPVDISYPDDDALRKYTPDFEVLLTSGQFLYVEVKPQERLSDPEIARKLEAIRVQLERDEIRFEVLTCADIRRQPRLNNIRWLYRQAGTAPVTAGAADFGARRLAATGPHTIGSAHAALRGTGLDPAILILKGICACDLDHPVSFETPIHLAQENSHERFRISRRLGF